MFFENGQFLCIFLHFASINLTVYLSKSAELQKYIHTVRLMAASGHMVGMNMTNSLHFTKPLIQPALVGIVLELWLIYMTMKDQSLSHYTQSTTPAYKCFNYNFKGICTRTHC